VRWCCQPERLPLLGWADDVQALADRLGLERLAVVGYSAGGGYALGVCGADARAHQRGWFGLL
jgi:pimeloyl-ACP methyl ester carboxylesterase